MTKTTVPAKARRVSVLTLANKITILRILMIPVIVIGVLNRQTLWVYTLVGLSMLTDALDGLVARRRGERTKLGAFLDPMADKLLLTALFITLTYMGTLETWVFVVFFSRDLLIVLGWGVIHVLTGSSTISPRLLGKSATAAQMLTALALLIPETPPVLDRILVWVSVAMTAASAADYVVLGEKRLGEWG